MRTSSPAQIGAGEYHYQLVLRDADGKPQAKTPFALSVKKRRLPFVVDRKNVWQGVTDEVGRTPVFGLPFRLREQAILLRGRMGAGPYGEQMLTTDDRGKPIANIPYRLVLCTDAPRQFVGRTDAGGYTVYAASSQPADIKLFMDYSLDGEGGHGGEEPGKMADCGR